MAILATSTQRTDARQDRCGGLIFDWYIVDEHGQSIKLTFFGDMVPHVRAMHESKRMPILFTDMCIAKKGNQARNLFAIANTMPIISP